MNDPAYPANFAVQAILLSAFSLVRCLVEQGEMSETEIRELGEWIESHRKGD